MSDSPTSKRRGPELYAASVATFIGVLALIVSGYTAYLQRQQLRAQVWPQLRIVYSDVFHHISVMNNGTGPARITGVRVTSGGLVVRSWSAVQRLAGYQPNEWITRSTIHRSVISADKELEMVRAHDDRASEARFMTLLDGPRHIDVTICYCSVLDECWLTSTLIEDQLPISDCPIPATEQFKD